MDLESYPKNIFDSFFLFFFYHFSKDLLQALGVLYPDLITLLLGTGCTCGN
jgi:hypothetical protein